eukprot:scaffold731_cov261-Pinguiococcus_pyrenoidosus.AAC.31
MMLGRAPRSCSTPRRGASALQSRILGFARCSRARERSRRGRHRKHDSDVHESREAPSHELLAIRTYGRREGHLPLDARRRRRDDDILGDNLEGLPAAVLPKDRYAAAAHASLPCQALRQGDVGHVLRSGTLAFQELDARDAVPKTNRLVAAHFGNFGR